LYIGVGTYIERGRQVHEEDVPALEEDENRGEREIQASCSQPGMHGLPALLKCFVVIAECNNTL